jgi:diamine N-acetyltransferase
MNKLLENNHIRLRAPEPEDIDILYKWENDTTLWEYGASITPYSRFDLKQYIIDIKHDIYSDRQLRLMAINKIDGAIVGATDLYDFEPFHRRAGVGILIDSNYRKQGYGLMVLNILEEYAFSFLNLKQLYAMIPENNKVSRELFTKAEYKNNGKLNEWLSKGNSFEDVLIMQKINNRV